MNKASRLLATTIVGALAFASSANAETVINFNNNSDNSYFVPTVTSNGFIATENLAEQSMGTNKSVDGVGPSNGTIHLDSWTNNGSNSIWTLTEANGAAFTLNAFDYATFTYNSGNAATSLTLTGTTTANAQVTQTFAPKAGAFQTFTLQPTFTNLKSVQFNAFGLKNRSAYDNIVVTAAGAVPEPASWAMMMVGVGAVGFAMRRRGKVATTVKFA